MVATRVRVVNMRIVVVYVAVAARGELWVAVAGLGNVKVAFRAEGEPARVVEPRHYRGHGGGRQSLGRVCTSFLRPQRASCARRRDQEPYGDGCTQGDDPKDHPTPLDLRRFRGLFETGNSARKGEQCHERTRPTLRSFAEKLSGWLELPMRSTLSPRSPARSVSPMAPFGAGSTKTRSTAASEKGSRQRRRKSSADSDAR